MPLVTEISSSSNKSERILTKDQICNLKDALVKSFQETNLISASLLHNNNNNNNNNNTKLSPIWTCINQLNLSYNSQDILECLAAEIEDILYNELCSESNNNLNLRDLVLAVLDELLSLTRSKPSIESNSSNKTNCLSDRSSNKVNEIQTRACNTGDSSIDMIEISTVQKKSSLVTHGSGKIESITKFRLLMMLFSRVFIVQKKKKDDNDNENSTYLRRLCEEVSNSSERSALDLVLLIVHLPTYISNICHQLNLELPQAWVKASFYPKILYVFGMSSIDDTLNSCLNHDCGQTYLLQEGINIDSMSLPGVTFIFVNIISKLASLSQYSEVTIVFAKIFTKIYSRRPKTLQSKSCEILRNTIYSAYKLMSTDFTRVALMQHCVYIIDSEYFSRQQELSVNFIKATALSYIEESVSEERLGVLESLLDKLVINGRRFSPQMCEILVEALQKSCTEDKGEGSSNESICSLSLRYVANHWAESSSIHGKHEESQRMTTQFLVSVLWYNKSLPLDPAIISPLLTGVSNRLKSQIKHVRLGGMVVGEAIGRSLGDTEGVKFDELHEPSSEVEYILHSEVGNIDTNTEIEVKYHETIEINQEKYEIDDDYNSIASFDDDELMVPFDTSDEQSSDPIIPSKKISKDIRVNNLFDSNAANPKFLRECLHMLRASQNDDQAKTKHQVALASLLPIIESAPMDLPDLAVVLTHQLIFLENMFDLPDFDEQRLSITKELFIKEPERVGDCLVDALFDDITMGTRFQILDLLMQVSQILSGKPRKTHPTKSNLLHDRISGSMGKRSIVKTEENEQQGKEESKTRRWGRRNAPQSIKNNFAIHSNRLFYQIFAGFMRTRENVALWGSDKKDGDGFLAKILLTLSVFTESAGKRTTTELLAVDLFNLSWSFRLAKSAEVRQSVLVGIITSIQYLSLEELIKRLSDGGNDSLVAFLEDTVMADPDPKCRELAKELANSLAEPLKSIIDLQGNFGSK